LSGGGTPALTAADFIGDVVERTGLSGFEAMDDVRLVLCPDLFNGYDGSDKAKETVKAVQTAMIADCERLRYRFAILDTPPGLNAQQAKEWREWVNFDSSFAAMYYPWIRVADLSDSPQTSKLMPPSGHVVGVYNRVDAAIGFHKAPANEIVAGAIDLEINLTKGEQSVLNPIGVNCIRSFTGRGIRIWGARTLSSDGSWRYINVRRLFIVVGASLDTGMQWVVFEPNDRMLWSKVRRDVTAFLSTVWLSGALFGSSKDEAFYVKCDDELNPPEIRDLGQLIVEIGMAPVKPAEFVIFRLSQWAGPNAEG
jgi:phage tail sheath protein FI